MTRKRGQFGSSPKKQVRLNILRLYRQGRTKQELAVIFGLSVHAIANILSRAGVREP